MLSFKKMVVSSILIMGLASSAMAALPESPCSLPESSLSPFVKGQYKEGEFLKENSRLVMAHHLAKDFKYQVGLVMYAEKSTIHESSLCEMMILKLRDSASSLSEMSILKERQKMSSEMSSTRSILGALDNSTCLSDLAKSSLYYHFYKLDAMCEMAVI